MLGQNSLPGTEVLWRNLGGKGVNDRSFGFGGFGSPLTKEFKLLLPWMNKTPDFNHLK